MSQLGLEKSRGTRDQIANVCWITEKAREFQKNIYFCFIDYAKAFDTDHNKLENSMDGGAWWAAVHGIAESQTRLSDFTFTLKEKRKFC